MPGGRSMVTMGMPGVTNTSQPSAGVGFTWAFAAFAGLDSICDIFDPQFGRKASRAGRRRRVVTVPNDSSLSPGHPRCFTRCGFLNRLCGGTDDVEHAIRLGEHGDVAALKLVGCSAHALGEKALEIGMNRAVFSADDVPARLRSPGGAIHLLGEEVRGGRVVRGPDDLFLLLGEVSREALDAFR